MVVKIMERGEGDKTASKLDLLRTTNGCGDIYGPAYLSHLGSEPFLGSMSF
jgi:hypothetical protein